MGRRKSRFLEFVPLFVERHFSGNPDILRKVALDAKLRAEKEIMILSKYNMDLDYHKLCNNKHSAFYSKGCGCEYCIARHNYVVLKRSLHREKRAFESDYFVSNDMSDREMFFERKEHLKKQILEAREIKNMILHELLETGIRIVED